MGTPGGSSGRGASYYRVGIPPLWAKKMGITKGDRDIRLAFDCEKVVIEKTEKIIREKEEADLESLLFLIYTKINDLMKPVPLVTKSLGSGIGYNSINILWKKRTSGSFSILHKTKKATYCIIGEQRNGSPIY